MAIKRTSSNSLVNATKMSTGFSSAAIPNAPTIGAATAVDDVSATVAYTAAVLGANGVTFTATSNPSSITGTGSSPITVTGLTASTGYTFTVTAGNANGTSAASSASNSITTSAPLNSYESIATVTAGSGGSSTIDFTSIPSTYTHLQIRGIARSTFSGLGDTTIYMRFNSDSGANYSWHRLYGYGSVGGDTSTSTTSVAVGVTARDGEAANLRTPIIIDILDYKNTNKYKPVQGFSGVDTNSALSIFLNSGNWRNTNAITSITLYTASNLAQYSSFALYGIKA